MKLRIDPSRRLTGLFAGVAIFFAIGFCWSLIRWQRAERQMELAQQRLAQHEYARTVAEAQRLLEPAQSLIRGPAETNAQLGLPPSDGPGVPAHIDAGMLIDGAEMNRKHAIGSTELLDEPLVVPNGGLVPKEIDEGMMLDRFQNKLPVPIKRAR